jgi:arabinan endo-1,5-alpha-L-arabinosidase
MAAPAAQPGQHDNFQPMSVWRSEKGALMAAYSDEFSGSSLGSQWSWVREPASGTYGVSDGAFHMQTQHADLYQELNTASVLVENAPAGEWLLEARVRLTVPAEGCCYNFRQAGLVIYGNDDKFLKLVHFANWETRQTEWAKEVPDATPGPRYGNTIVGPPGEWTTLRIVKANFRGGTFFQAWTKRDDGVWERGGTWRYDGLNGNVKIGIVSMGAGGPADQDIVTEAQIDWLHVYDLHVRGPVPIHER